VSGIVAIIRTDGAAVDPALAHALTATLAYRGPDAQETRCAGPAALGHTLLRTGAASDDDRQPLTLDGETWIVADGRVDARATLLADLESEQCSSLSSASDAEMILRAFMKWDAQCVEHLLGDFAFAIWCAPSGRLFCARDHLGVKPLYYAQVGAWLIVSNTLECIRRHPAVSDALDDLAVADFLLFGHKTDDDATTFRDIRRVPSAHTLTWSAPTSCLVRRYWQLPVEEPIYRREGEYVEQFTDLLRLAVSDRLRADRVGIFLSGGIDSTALAATAAAMLCPSARAPVRGFTLTYQSLISDEESRYAAAAAQHLGIPYESYVVDREPGWDDFGDAGAPEPCLSGVGAKTRMRVYADMAEHGRVALYGEGPDNALVYEWQPYLAYLCAGRRWTRLAADFAQFVKHHKRLPLLRTIVGTRRGRAAVHAPDPRLPRWIAPALVDRLELTDRWRRRGRSGAVHHPIRPIAYSSLAAPLWQTVFEELEPSYTRVPLEVRHPYLDIRLLHFLLGVPAIPWCREKHLLRHAFRGVLPEIVRLRPKAPLRGDPDYENVRRHGWPPVRPTPRLSTYGSPEKLAEPSPATPSDVAADLRFIGFSHWLHGLEHARPVHRAYCLEKPQA